MHKSKEKTLEHAHIVERIVSKHLDPKIVCVDECRRNLLLRGYITLSIIELFLAVSYC